MIKRVKLIEDDDDLTPKQRKFVAEFAVDQNQTQAAIRAGFSKRSAPVLAHRLLKNVNVVKAIRRATANALSESTSRPTESSRNWPPWASARPTRACPSRATRSPR